MPTPKPSKLCARALRRESKPTRVQVLPAWFAANPAAEPDFAKYLATLKRRGVHVSLRDMVEDLTAVYPDFPVKATALRKYLMARGHQFPSRS